MRASMQDPGNKRDFEAGPTVRQTVFNTSDAPVGNHPRCVDGIEWHDFRNERDRLLSYVRCPWTAAKSATLLANDGFVYTGVGDETDDATTCYFCGVRKKDWHAWDIVSNIHNPTCPMVTKTHCANVPISTNRAGDELQVKGGSTHCVEKTEMQKPDQVSGQKTSEDVNIHTAIPRTISSNMTKCEPRMEIQEEIWVTTVSCHQKCFGSERTHSSPQHTTSINYKNNNTPYNNEDDIILKTPKSPDYTSKASRLPTFANWPSGHHLKPCDLSEAGFYYTNTRDRVRCFHCGGRLQSWDYASDIWVEHARWYPKCGHVRQQLGQTFVDTVNELSKTNEQISYQMVEEALNSKWLKDSISTFFAMDTSLGKSAASKKLSTSKTEIVFTNVQKRTGDEIVEEPNNAALNIDTASPKSLRHTAQKERLKTFKGWPKSHPLKPRDFSAAGFYYEGAGDATRCYHCGGAIRNWSHSRNVFVLHAKWFPYCSHIRLLVGQSFVDTVQEWRRAGESSLASLYSMLSPKEIETITAGSKKRKTRAGKGPLCKMCKESHVVVTFLSCGHLVTCAQCGAGVEKCPVCQIHVDGRVRANF